MTVLTEYDRIGATYASTRRADPRIAARIEAALGDARSVLNVGAGAGSYEPAGRDVLAVEPSRVMIAQRPPGSATAVQAVAERLPLPDASFDAAMALLSVHHWRDRDAGLRELRRVARKRVVALSWDQAAWEPYWLNLYFPAFIDFDRRRVVPLDAFAAALRPVAVHTVPVPHDCSDGFGGAYWRRPEAYLRADVRDGSSLFQLVPLEEVERGVRRLAEDLRSGAWNERFGHLRALDEIDLGYRLVVWEAEEDRRP